MPGAWCVGGAHGNAARHQCKSATDLDHEVPGAKRYQPTVSHACETGSSAPAEIGGFLIEGAKLFDLPCLNLHLPAGVGHGGAG